jgi:REP element-mobilizing transposase RayT
MANRYSQIYIHLVFVVKYRKSLINQTWDQELYQYISGIVNNKGHKSLAINGMPDHVHIFVGLNPTYAISNLVREIKKASTNWINNASHTDQQTFAWQSGYGAFSHSHSQIGDVIEYIRNQKRHHQKRSLKEEYLSLLEKWNIDYDERYLFEWHEI